MLEKTSRRVGVFQIQERSLERAVALVRDHFALLMLLAVYLVVTLTYGLLYPLGEAPDEVAHVDLIRFIGEEGHLPRDYVQRQAAGYKSDSPFLYHVLVGIATSWVDYDLLPRLKVSYASPRRLLVEDGLSPFALIHTDDEVFPYRGVVLAWHMARLASTVISAGTLLTIYATVLTICPENRELALGVTAVTAAIPQFHFIASVVNDDNLLGLLLALFTLTLVRVWRQPERHWPYIWLGLLYGIALTTKYTGGPFLLLVLVILARAIRIGEINWQTGASRFLLFGAASVAAAAWWFIYVEAYFNAVEELGVVSGLIKPLRFDSSTQLITSYLTGDITSRPGPVPHSATVSDWAILLFRSFWFVPSRGNQKAVQILSWVFLGLCCLAFAGFWRAWRREGDLPRPILGLLVLQILLMFPVPLLRFYLTLSPDEAGQARHILFPAATAVGLLLTYGASAWLPATRRHHAGPALAGILLAISLVSFLGFVLPASPPRLPIRTLVGAVNNAPNPLDITFEDSIRLAGYELGEINQYGALPITLVWHSLALVDQDYLIELSLLDKEGVVRSMWLGHPVNGRYPTRAWEPDDVVRDTIWLPLTGVGTGSYRLQLRLHPSFEFAPDRHDRTDTPPADEARFLLPMPYALNSIPHSPTDIRPSFIVWQTGQPVASMPVFGYRAAIPISFLKPQVRVTLVGPDGIEQPPRAQVGNTYIFLVDAFWASGEYALETQSAGERIKSDPILRVQFRPRSFDVPPISTEVHANFGDEIMLLGFDFPKRRVEPGGALPITLYWQSEQLTASHYIVSNHLLDNVALRQWGGRDRVPQDYYTTVLWTPGEVVRDSYLVPVDPSAPSGVYRLDIGLYTEIQGQARHLPLVADGEVLDATGVTISPIKVGGPPQGATIKNPSPQYPRADNLEGLITLLGYDLNFEDGTVDVTLYWRCDAVSQTDYTTFVHVRASGDAGGVQPGPMLAQKDRPPADGAYPTSLWDPGEVIRDYIQISLPSEMPPGQYEIVVGLYDFSSGQRLLLLDDLGKATSDHIRLDNEIIAR
jgi:hypothetical protein